MVFLLVTFVIAWTPYAAAAFISSFFSPTLISPLGATLPGNLIFIFPSSYLFFFYFTK
jgi:hypothetical protein